MRKVFSQRKAKWGSLFAEKGQGRVREERQPRAAEVCRLRGTASVDTCARKMTQTATEKE